MRLWSVDHVRPETFGVRQHELTVILKGVDLFYDAAIAQPKLSATDVKLLWLLWILITTRVLQVMRGLAKSRAAARGSELQRQPDHPF